MHIPRWKTTETNNWFQVIVCETSLGIPKIHWLKPILANCLPPEVLCTLHISSILSMRVCSSFEEDASKWYTKILTRFRLWIRVLDRRLYYIFLPDRMRHRHKIQYFPYFVCPVHCRCYSWSAIWGTTQRLTWWPRISRSSSAPMIRVSGAPAVCPTTSTWRSWRSLEKTPIYDCWRSWQWIQ